jgi:hypothetical protein
MCHRRHLSHHGRYGAGPMAWGGHGFGHHRHHHHGHRRRGRFLAPVLAASVIASRMPSATAPPPQASMYPDIPPSPPAQPSYRNVTNSDDPPPYAESVRDVRKGFYLPGSAGKVSVSYYPVPLDTVGKESAYVMVPPPPPPANKHLSNISHACTVNLSPRLLTFCV